MATVADSAPSLVTRPSGISLPRYVGGPEAPTTPFTSFMPPSDTATRPSGISLPRYQPQAPRRSVVPVPVPDLGLASGPLADLARYTGLGASGASIASRLTGSPTLGQFGAGLGLASNLFGLPVIAGGPGSTAQKALGAGQAGLGILSGASQFEPIRQFMPQGLQDALALRVRDVIPALSPAADSISGISGAVNAGTMASSAAADALTGGTVPLATGGVGEAAGNIPLVNIAAALLNFGMGVAGGRDVGEAAARAVIGAIPIVGTFAGPIGDAIFGRGIPSRGDRTKMEAAKQAAESGHYANLYDRELAAITTPEQFADWYASRFTAPGYSGRYQIAFDKGLPVEQVRPFTLQNPDTVQGGDYRWDATVPLGSQFVKGGVVGGASASATPGLGPTVPINTLLHYLQTNPDLVNVTMPGTGDLVSPGPYVTGLKNALVAAARRIPSVAAPQVFGAGYDVATDPAVLAYRRSRPQDPLALGPNVAIDAMTMGSGSLAF